MRHYAVHYGELALKGGNRRQFETQLARNIRAALQAWPGCRVRPRRSHITLEVPDDAPLREVEDRLAHIFGIAYIAPVTVVPPTLEAMAEAAVTMTADLLDARTTFKVDTHRSDKGFPLHSIEVNREIGARIVEATGAPVRLRNPDVTLTIYIYRDAAHLFLRRIPGAGGLPVGVSGRVLVLLSGGIDSPVAARMLMQRGCPLDFVHFHMLPGHPRETKITALARKVVYPHHLRSTLYMVSAAPFEAAMAAVQTRVATVVFRRFMMRVAEQLARRTQALALVTGESVGQVASQTLQNMALIAQATTLPILRPLVGMDKAEIVARAQRIGTYELSIQAYQDPCSLHGRRPATHADPKTVQAVEARLDIPALVEETLSDYTEAVPIAPPDTSPSAEE